MASHHLLGSIFCLCRYGIFLFFGAWVVIMTVTVQVFLPETKGVPIEDMSKLWDRSLPEEDSDALLNANDSQSTAT